MGRDLPHARAYREGHLDQIVERRLIARGAERAIILRPIQGLQAFVGGKNPGAARAHHAPCHLEHAEPHRIQQRCDDPLFVDALRAGEIKRVHLVQGMIRGIPHHPLEHVDNGFVGRLTQGRKQRLGFAHAAMLPERRQREHPLTHRSQPSPAACAWRNTAESVTHQEKSPRRNRGLFAQTALAMSVSEWRDRWSGLARPSRPSVSSAVSGR